MTKKTNAIERQKRRSLLRKKRLAEFDALSKQIAELGKKVRSLDQAFNEKLDGVREKLQKKYERELAALDKKEERILKKRKRIFTIVALRFFDEMPDQDHYAHEYAEYKTEDRYWGEETIETNIRSDILACISGYCKREALADCDIQSYVYTLFTDALREAGYYKIDDQLDNCGSQIQDLKDKMDEEAGCACRKEMKEYDKERNKVRNLRNRRASIALMLGEGLLFHKNAWRITKDIDAVIKKNPVDLDMYLVGLNYPADRESIVYQAEANGATEEIISMLERLKEKTYAHLEEIERDVKEILHKAGGTK